MYTLFMVRNIFKTIYVYYIYGYNIETYVGSFMYTLSMVKPVNPRLSSEPI